MRVPTTALASLLIVVACSEEFTASDGDGGASGGTAGLGGSAGSGALGGVGAVSAGGTGASSGGSGGALTDAALGGSGGKVPLDGGSDAQVIAACAPGKVGDLKETFDSTWTTNWGTWADPGAQASVANGMAQLKIQAGANAYVGFYTKQTWNIRDCAVSVQIVKAPDATSQSTEIYFSATDANLQNGAIFTAYEGKLFFTHRIAGVKKDETQVTHDPAAQRFWRFREAGGTTYYETSPDGKKWLQQFQSPTNPEANAYYVEVAGGVWQAQTTSVAMLFDNVNVVP